MYSRCGDFPERYQVMNPIEKAWGNMLYIAGGNSNSGSTPFGDYYGLVFIAGVVLAAVVVLWATRRRRIKASPSSR